MKIERLTEMANDIGAFFIALPDRDEARDGIEGHLRKFWDPRMRRQIIDYVLAGGEGLDPLVESAVRRLAENSKTTAA